MSSECMLVKFNSTLLSSGATSFLLHQLLLLLVFQPAMPSSYQQCRHFAPSCSVRLGSLLRLFARTSPEQLPKPKSKLPEPEYFWLLSILYVLHPVPRQLPDCRHRHPADHKHLLEEQFVCATEGRSAE